MLHYIKEVILEIKEVASKNLFATLQLFLYETMLFFTAYCL